MSTRGNRESQTHRQMSGVANAHTTIPCSRFGFRSYSEQNVPSLRVLTLTTWVHLPFHHAAKYTDLLGRSSSSWALSAYARVYTQMHKQCSCNSSCGQLLYCRETLHMVYRYLFCIYILCIAALSLFLLVGVSCGILWVHGGLAAYVGLQAVPQFVCIFNTCLMTFANPILL